MATETHTGDLIALLPLEVDLSGEFDPVLITAADRPDTDTLPVMADPAADHENVELRRRRDGYRAEASADSRLPRRHRARRGRCWAGPTPCRWFTSGGDLGQDFTSEYSSILLYINHTCRAVISDNVQSTRVFEEELAGLGFQLKERPVVRRPVPPHRRALPQQADRHRPGYDRMHALEA